MRALELGGAALAALIGLTALALIALSHAPSTWLGLAWLGGLGPLGLGAIGLSALYLVGICGGAYLHAGRGTPFGLGLLWGCALSLLASSLVVALWIGAGLVPAALVALTAAMAGTLDARASEVAT